MEEERRKKLEPWLKEDDKKSFDYRMERLDFLEKEFGKGRSILFFGTTPGMAFDEARLTYLNGLYVSCILITEAIIEQSFAGMFYAAGNNEVAKHGYRKVIEKAYRENWIDDEDYRTLVSINTRRNSLVHFRSPGDNRHPMYQATSEGKDFWDMVQDDAKTILSVLFRMLARSPFRGA